MSETRAPYRLPPNPVRAATLLALAQAALALSDCLKRLGLKGKERSQHEPAQRPR